MRISLFFLMLVCVLVASAARWSCTADGPGEPDRERQAVDRRSPAPASPEEPAPSSSSPQASEAAGVGVLSCRVEGHRLLATLRNEGGGALVCKTRNYDDTPPEVEDIRIVLKTPKGEYVAPVVGCATGRRDGLVELAPGQSVSRVFVRDRQAALELQIPPPWTGWLVAEVEVASPAGMTTLRSEPILCPTE